MCFKYLFLQFTEPNVTFIALGDWGDTLLPGQQQVRYEPNNCRNVIKFLSVADRMVVVLVCVLQTAQG